MPPETKIHHIKNFNKNLLTYRVFLAITTDSDARSRYGRIHKVADGYWRFLWLTCIDSKYVVAFTHGHGTVTWYVVLQTRLGTNVYLHHRQVVSHMTKLTTIIFHKRRLTIVHLQQTPICNCNNCQNKKSSFLAFHCHTTVTNKRAIICYFCQNNNTHNKLWKVLRKPQYLGSLYSSTVGSLPGNIYGSIYR